MSKSKSQDKIHASLSSQIERSDKFSSNEFLEPTLALLKSLDELSALQDKGVPLRVVDADVPLESRFARLMAWLRTHPLFSCQGFALSERLPSLAGARGLVATAPLDAGATVFSIPADCTLSTQTASCSIELGSLLEDPRINLRNVPTMILTLLIMIEHAKALKAAHVERREKRGPPGLGDPAAAAESSSSNSSVPQIRPRGLLAMERATWERETYGSESARPAASHSGHGHSHGGAACDADHSPMRCTQLLHEVHPWGSQFRAYLSLLPQPTDMKTCLYFDREELAGLVGTPAGPGVAEFIRDNVKAYLAMHEMFVTAELISGFGEYYTWSAFKWATSVVMSRQNKLPTVPASAWPAGVPRYGEDEPFHLALIPLYDMINHESGPITSYFLGDTISLEAMRPYAAGEQITMSYGTRPSDATLQFQGFVDETNDADFTVVSASLPPLIPDCGGDVTHDPLFRIRTNVLSGVLVSPEHNAKRGLRRPAMVSQFRAAQTSSAPDARAKWERLKWSLPFQFVVTHDATSSAPAAAASPSPISPDLLSFLRVASIRNKAEATDALRQCDAAQKMVAAVAADRALKQRVREEKRARAAAGAAALVADAAATDAGASEASPPSTADADASSNIDDVYDDDDEDAPLPQMAIGKLSDENEAAATTALIGVYSTAIRALDEGYNEAASPLPSDSVVLRYRRIQRRLLENAAACAVEAKGGAAGGGKPVQTQLA